MGYVRTADEISCIPSRMRNRPLRSVIFSAEVALRNIEHGSGIGVGR